MGDAFAVYKYWFGIRIKRVSKLMLYLDAIQELGKLRKEPHGRFITYNIKKVELHLHLNTKS